VRSGKKIGRQQVKKEQGFEGVKNRGRQVITSPIGKGEVTGKYERGK